MKPLPLRTSLTLSYTGLLAVLVTAVALGYHWLLVRQVDRDATTSLEELVRGLHGYVEFTDDQPTLVYDERDADAAAFVEDATRYYQIFDAATGRLLVQSRGFAASGVDYTAGEVSVFLRQRNTHDVQTDRGRFRISSSVITPQPGREYLLQVGLPLERMDQSIARFERLMFWGVVLGLVASAALGRWMAARALAPLSRMADATRSIEVTTLDRRIPVRGADDELDDVAHAFNQALDRVDRTVAEMRQFSAALAHELRTPLAILRGETELALTTPQAPEQTRQQLVSQLEELDRLNGLITQILTLARAESGQISLTRQPVDLTSLARTTVEQLEAVAEASGIVLTCSAPETVQADGDPAWLERLLLILLDNAIKFTPEGGHIGVTVSREGKAARIDVSDTGLGIAADVVPHLFVPFYRADPARSRHTQGAGLGLALAKWIADKHHGTIDVESHPGRGSTFTVKLPAAALEARVLR